MWACECETRIRTVCTHVCTCTQASSALLCLDCFNHHPPDIRTSDVHLLVSKPSSIAVAPLQSTGTSARWLPVTKSSNSSASVRTAPMTCTPLAECFPSTCRLMISHRVRKSLRCKQKEIWYRRQLDDPQIYKVIGKSKTYKQLRT